MAQRDPKRPATQDVVHAPYISRSEVPTIGDVPVEVEIKRPYSHADYSCCQSVDRFTPGLRNSRNRRRNQRFIGIPMVRKLCRQTWCLLGIGSGNRVQFLIELIK